MTTAAWVSGITGYKFALVGSAQGWLNIQRDVWLTFSWDLGNLWHRHLHVFAITHTVTLSKVKSFFSWCVFLLSSLRDILSVEGICCVWHCKITQGFLNTCVRVCGSAWVRALVFHEAQGLWLFLITTAVTSSKQIKHDIIISYYMTDIYQETIIM